jgi:hypothetical protein
MDSKAKVVKAGDLVHIEYDEYWDRKKTLNIQGNMLAHHTAWGLASINKFNPTTNMYELMVVDPHVYMMKCIEYGW